MGLTIGGAVDAPVGPKMLVGGMEDQYLEL